MLPPQDRPSLLPLPSLIRADTVLQHAVGSIWWAGVNFEMTLEAIFEAAGDFSKSDLGSH